MCFYIVAYTHLRNNEKYVIIKPKIGFKVIGMKCENELCVYQDKGYCILEGVAIDSNGRCTECVYPDIDKRLLTLAKNRFLKKVAGDK